jgi:hypothetical protein
VVNYVEFVAEILVTPTFKQKILGTFMRNAGNNIAIAHPRSGANPL